MVKLKMLILCGLLFGNPNWGNTQEPAKVSPARLLYDSIAAPNSPKPDFDLFEMAYSGYKKLENEGKLNKQILTIIDFRLSSNVKRMWVFDLENKSLLFHNLVAHGRNSGEEFANSFSNIPMSKKSSLGFYVTGGTYYGKHGLSLYLNGMEKGINNEARSRAIVLHGAEYVSQAFSRKYGRLGRSFGCPAVPMKIHQEVIYALKDKSCLFIYFPDKKYVENSVFLRLY